MKDIIGEAFHGASFNRFIQRDAGMEIKNRSNYSAPIHQYGEKPVLFVPAFFSGAFWLFAELAKTKV
jgi:hypothetical protein